MSSHLITGAAKGLGLELTKQLLALPSIQVGLVFALSRGEPNPDLQTLINENSDRLKRVKVSIDGMAEVESAAQEVESQLGDRGLDVLINNAGIRLQSDLTNINGKTGNSTDKMSTKQFNTNVIGSHRMPKAFLPLLRAGREKLVIDMCVTSPTSVELANATWVSTTMGSIAMAESNYIAPTQVYKTFNAGLNMLIKQWVLDYADEGPGGAVGDFAVDNGAKQMVKIMLEATPALNGKFVKTHVPGQEKAWGRYDGKEMSW